MNFQGNLIGGSGVTAGFIALLAIAVVAAYLIRRTGRYVSVLARDIHDLEARVAAEKAEKEDARKRVLEAGDIVRLERRVGSLQGGAPTKSTNSLESKSSGQMITLAESLACLRPLVPYPRWRFDADWTNPDLAFQLRQRVWRYIHDRRMEAPITVDWYGGTSLRLHLGNDLSRQLYVAGCLDPNEFVFLSHYLSPGMTFLDIGANEGIYTVFAARQVGPGGTVWAFEPSRRELERLQCNVDLNNLRVQVFPLALADFNGQAELTLADYGHEGLNTLGAFVYSGIGAQARETVEVARLDDVVAADPPARIDVIKIDVEGAELRLLKGAVSTLKKYRPVLMVEVSDAALQQQQGCREELVDFLRVRDYDWYLFDPESGIPVRAEREAFGDNMIAAPVGKSLPPAVFDLWPNSGS